uniref:C-type lectin domain-containing protein n=1 Tax=Pelusios castaneus TaxID=367368 RepID=A0A8C8S7R8_9SAUR
MAEESPEMKVSLRDPGTQDAQSGRKPDPQWNCSQRHYRLCIIVLGAVSLTLFITVIVLAGQHGKSPSADLCPPAGPACPDGWVGYRGKCYYFSVVEENWAYSQTHCSALNASLAGIDTRQDMDFMVRCKCRFDHWIGLRRDPGQPWKWANGTEFNNCGSG